MLWDAPLLVAFLLQQNESTRSQNIDIFPDLKCQIHLLTHIVRDPPLLEMTIGAGRRRKTARDELIKQD